MAATKYTYSISGDTAVGEVAPGLLTEQIDGAGLSTALQHIDTDDDVLDVWFVDTLSAGDETALDALVAAHDPTGWAPPSEATRVENFVFVASDNEPYGRIKKSKWHVVARLRFRGSRDLGAPLAVKAVGWSDAGGELTVRLYDLTNDQMICAGGSTTSAEPAIVDLGSPTSASEAEAVWEVQAKVDAGEGRLHSLSIDYA